MRSSSEEAGAGTRRRRVRRRATVLLLASLAGGCSARIVDPLVQPSVISARDRDTRALQLDLATLLTDPALSRGLVGVRIESLSRDEVLFRHNDERLMLPASNQKIVTVAAAAELLGWDYRFVTTLSPTGPIQDGVLQGDLVVVGSGDPTLSRRYQDPAVTFAGWAGQLRAAGIRTIAGRLVGDARAFSDEIWGNGWAWQDLQNAYAAPVGALQVHDNVTTVTVTPGAAPGEPARVSAAEVDGGFTIEATASTSPAGAPNTLQFARVPGTWTLRIGGSIAAGSPPFERRVAVRNPTAYFLASLRDALEAGGILVNGGIAELESLLQPVVPGGTPLVHHQSPTLGAIAAVTMKTSHNLHAESLFRAVARDGALVGNVSAARSIVAGVLESWGVPGDAVVIADGSGLSRHNHVTASALMRVLRRMAADDRHRDGWLASFPVGSEGSLSSRFIDGVAKGRVRAKTGELAAVRALSGYVRTEAGELLAFVMIVNNATGTRPEVDAVLDRAVERLVSFRRQ